MMVRMRNLFGFVNNLEKIMHGLGFKLTLKRNNKDRALYRINAGAGAIANDGKIEIRDISWCIPSIDPRNDNRIIVQKGINKKNNIDFSYYGKKCFTRMYPMPLAFYLNLVWKVLLKGPNA